MNIPISSTTSSNIFYKITFLIKNYNILLHIFRNNSDNNDNTFGQCVKSLYNSLSKFKAQHLSFVSHNQPSKIGQDLLSSTLEIKL